MAVQLLQIKDSHHQHWVYGDKITYGPTSAWDITIGHGLSIHPKYLCISSGDGDGRRKDGDSGEKIDKEKPKENNLANITIPLCCAADGDADNPSTPTMYDCRKYGHNLPCDSVAPYFQTLPYIPTGIFRCTYGETLGRGANKCSYYQNPEYFSYHHMTFYDMHLILRPCRQPSPKTGRKP